MGAQYYPDWIESATHLICRFTNTPKFISVLPFSLITPPLLRNFNAFILLFH